MFVVLGIQRAIRMRYNVICGQHRSKYFSTLSHKRHNVLQSVTQHKMCFFIFNATFVWNILILRTKQIW